MPCQICEAADHETQDCAELPEALYTCAEVDDLIAEEREACAKVAERGQHRGSVPCNCTACSERRLLAAAIRARGTQ